MPIQGYLSKEDIGILAKYASRCSKPIADIGCHRWLSTSVLAHAASSLTGVYAVDPHAAFRGINGMVCSGKDRAEFYQNMLDENLAERVSLVGLPSELAARSFPPESLGMVFIDGDHDKARLDMQLWLSCIAPGGYMLFHDIDIKPVQDAIQWALQDCDLDMVEVDGITAVMKKHPERLTETSDGRPLLFIHIPKTAGLSVLYHIARYEKVSMYNHLTAIQCHSLLGTMKYNEAFSFSVVRNPIDRMYSAWNYLQSQEPGHRWWESDAQERDEIQRTDLTFPGFVMDSTTDRLRVMPHFVSQRSFLCIGNSRLVRHMLRYEHLQEDWAALMDICGAKGRTLPMNNVTPKVDKRPQPWRSDKMVIDKIKRLYAEDFELLQEFYQ